MEPKEQQGDLILFGILLRTNMSEPTLYVSHNQKAVDMLTENLNLYYDDYINGLESYQDTATEVLDFMDTYAKYYRMIRLVAEDIIGTKKLKLDPKNKYNKKDSGQYLTIVDQTKLKTKYDGQLYQDPDLPENGVLVSHYVVNLLSKEGYNK
jgi:hypothetical protein